MTGFRFEALDTSGRLKKGVIEADSPRLARHQLRDQGLLPVEITALRETQKQSLSFLERWTGGLSTSELALLTRQFAGLLGAGLTIEETLNALIDQAETQKIKDIVAGVRAEVVGGQSLAKSMARQAHVFNALYRTLVAAGEASGHLSQVMEALAGYLEKRAELQSKVRLALVYPAVISIVAISVVVGLLVWVMPQVVDVFIRQHQTLPLITRIMIALSEFIRTWGWLVLIGIGVFIWQLQRQWQVPGFRRSMEQGLYRLPVIGHWIRAVNSARLSSTLAILVGAGVPLVSALEAARGVVESLLMQQAIDQALQDLKQGRSLARALSMSRVFPSVMVHLIASGERTGELTVMLNHVATLQDKEVDERTTLLTKLLEPLLILGMGLMVLMIILSIMLPIFELNQIIR